MSAVSSIELQAAPSRHINDHENDLPHVPINDETLSSAPRNEQMPVSAQDLSNPRSIFVVVSISGITILNAFGQGLLIVAIPRIALDLKISTSSLQWPTAAATLTLGCSLLVVGAIADVVGNRPVFLAGCALHLIFGVGCALAQTGAQLIAFRAFQGLALAFCMPTAVSLVTSHFKEGKKRNFAFATFGGGNPVGYALGLLLGGLLTGTVGWRYAYYFCVALNALIFFVAFWSLPTESYRPASLARLRSSVDWTGLILVSTSLSLLSYVLASVTSATSLSPKRPEDIGLLVAALLLIPAFVFWVRRQEQLGKVALIPNSLWKRSGFTSVCVSTFLTWAMFNVVAFFGTLLMQEIQHVSALQTSLRFLPLVVFGTIANFVAGWLVDKVTASYLALATTILSAISPILFAILSPSWSYWAAMFPAISLLPLSSDLLFNVANLVITASFATSDQALAGAVFSTVSQLGSTFGLALSAVFASSVTASKHHQATDERDAILAGYRAAFYTCVAAGIVSCLVSSLGLRTSGKVGLKRE